MKCLYSVISVICISTIKFINVDSPLATFDYVSLQYVHYPKVMIKIKLGKRFALLHIALRTEARSYYRSTHLLTTSTIAFMRMKTFYQYCY